LSRFLPKSDSQSLRPKNILKDPKMQLILSSKIVLALVPFITTTLAQDGDKDSGPASASPLEPQVSSYLAHLTEKPQYSSVAAIVSTAVSGSRGQSRVLNGDLAKVTTRAWYDGLPSDVKSYASSVQNERNKLATASVSVTVTGAASSAAPAPKSAGGAAPSSAPASASSAPKGSSSAAAASQSATKNGAADTQARGLMGMGAGVAGVIGALVL
jgi:hypothetical protein